jgi:hypothetical protein
LKRIIATILLLGVLIGGGCQRKEGSESGPQGSASLPSWPREHFQPTGAKALVWYQVYGHFSDTIEISRGKYRCNGVPEGVGVGNHTRTGHEEAATSFLKQPFFVAQLHRELPEVAQAVEATPDCTIIRGEVPDSPNADYLRDVVGLVTWFLDNGAVAVLDPQTLTWYDREKWRSRVFEPTGFVPTRHVMVLFSEEKDGADKNLLWFHTRGMRKFARPDVSVHNVPAQYQGAVIDLLNRLVEAQAFGQVIADGQSITTQSLPPGMTGHHAGNLDDPDFNNTHIEIQWPK